MPSWEPSTEDVRRVLAEQNPWMGLGEVPAVLAPETERALGRALWSRVANDKPHRFQVVLGPRRVGKTTVMYQTVKHLIQGGVSPSRLWWFRLDHPLLLEKPLGDLVRGVVEVARPTSEEPLFIFLDELVYARDWDLWLKTFFDDRWPLRLVGTSSATAALSQRRTESGVGRWEEQFLMPYLFSEFLDLVGAGPTIDVGATLAETMTSLIDQAQPRFDLEKWRQRFVLTGGFPELLLQARSAETDPVTALLDSQRMLRSDAVERAIYKDIPQSFGVDQPMALERLLYTLAGQASNLLAPTNLCSTLGISQPTFDRYLSYLIKAFIVFALPNYSGSEASIQRRGRKLYFVDGAVRNAALQRGLTPLQNPGEMGLLVENLVASQLHALALHSGVRLYHWREGVHEVDLVYDHPERPVALEVGLSADHSRSGLVAFASRFPRFKGHCYLIAPNVQPVHPHQARSGVGTIPLDLFLVGSGRQAEAAVRL